MILAAGPLALLGKIQLFFMIFISSPFCRAKLCARIDKAERWSFGGHTHAASMLARCSTHPGCSDNCTSLCVPLQLEGGGAGQAEEALDPWGKIQGWISLPALGLSSNGEAPIPSGHPGWPHLSPTVRRRQQTPGSANKSGRDLKLAAISKGTLRKGRGL